MSRRRALDSIRVFDRKTIQELYIRVNKDSNFTLGFIKAAQLVGDMVGTTPLEVWLAMPSIDAMLLIAEGKHPSVAVSKAESEAKA